MRNTSLMRSLPIAGTDLFLDLDGARLRYRDEGSGFPLVLIHGWALDLEMWEPQIAAWSGRLRTIRFDRRGFGNSSGQPSLSADVHDLQALLRHLEVDRAALLGMSQGARVALSAVAPLRGRLACLILDGAPFEGATGESEIPLDRYRELARQQGLDAFRSEWRQHPLMQLRSRDSDAQLLLQRMTARYPGHDLLGDVEACVPEAPFIDNIDSPLLVLNGAFDTQQRRLMGDELCRAVPGAQRALVPGAGHLPNLDNAADYNRLVLSFIERHMAGS